MSTTYGHGTNWGQQIIADAIAKAEGHDPRNQLCQILGQDAHNNWQRDFDPRPARRRKLIRNIQVGVIYGAAIVSTFTVGAWLGAEVVRAACVGCGL